MIRRTFVKGLILCVAAALLAVWVPAADRAEANSTVGIALKNSEKSYDGTTLGMGGTVIPFGFHPSWLARDFNEDDLATLLTYFKKTGATVARLWVDGAWWEPVNDNADETVMNDAGFTWNSREMESLYKYVQGFKDAGVDLYVCLMSDDPKYMYPWLIAANTLGTSPNAGKYGEYAEHLAALVKQLVVVKGFTNVKYVSFNGEPNNFFFTPPGITKLDHYKATMTAVRNRLASENLLAYVKLIGPDISYADHDTSDWLNDLATNIPDSLDAYSIHSGQSKPDATSGAYYNLISGLISDIRARDPAAADKPFMVTDYTPTGTVRRAEDGLNAVALVANGLRAGASEFGRWTFAEDIWTWPFLANQTSTSFGDYGYGIVGSKQENFTPRPVYKATALLYKLVPKGSTTYKATTSNEAVIPAIVRTAGGNHTIIVVNWSDTAADATFTLDTPIGTTFRKYKFAPAELNTVDKFGEIPASFATKTVNGTTFTDTIPANTVYFYSDIADGTAPGQPTGLTAASPNFKQVRLQWTAVSDPDVAYYRVYRSETANFAPSLANKVGEIWIKPGGAPAFNDKNVDQGKTYYYKVSAVDGMENEGAASGQASVTVASESYTQTLTVTDSPDGYYEIDADFENGYKARLYKKAGVIGWVQDKLGYTRTNLNSEQYSLPMVFKYSSGAYTDKAVNGGAESGTTGPDGWSTWTDQGGVFTWDASVKHSGSRSLKIDNALPNTNSLFYQQTTNVIPGKEYVLSYWIKTNQVSGNADSGRGAYVNVQFLDSNGAILSSIGGFDAQSNTGTNDWTYFSSRMTAPPGTVTVQIGTMLYGNNGTAWFDDIRFEEQPDIAISGQRTLAYYEADSVTYNNISPSRKQIVTVVGNETLTYDFYSDRIEMKVAGPNAGGYYIEDGGIVQRNTAFAFWSDGTETALSDTFAGTQVAKNVSGVELYQPPSAQTVCYEFGSAKPVTVTNAIRFRGYYPRFQVNSGETFTLKFPKKRSNPNGGAEAGTTAPSGWTTWNQSGNVSFVWDASTAHWGSRSLKTTNTSADNSAWYAQVDQPNIANTYRWSSWIKTSGVASTVGQGAYLSVEAKDASYNVLAVYRTPFVTGTTDWKRYEIEFNLPEGTEHLLVEGNLYGASGTAWFDDLELNYADTGIHNAGAEYGSGGSPAGWATWTTGGTPFVWDTTTA
ncbi:carbohydrate binding domain-containing protein [Paenibacillus flagellatus]|nr:carbohydrate binding domain-containing protein [Paenibacillus flagellatus]